MQAIGGQLRTTIVERARTQFLVERAQQQLAQGLMYSNLNILTVSGRVSQYLSDNYRRELQLTLLKQLIREKMDIYDHMLNQNYKGVKRLYHKLWRFSQRQLRSQSYFESAFATDKSYLNSQYLIFFYAEVLQNFLQAHLQSMKKTTSQSVVIKNQNGMIDFALINQSVAHLRVGFIENNGKIISYSPNVPQFFGHTKDNFRYITHVHALMPRPFSLFHDQLVDRFLDTKQCKFFSNLDQCLALDKSGYCFKVYKCIYINIFTAHDGGASAVDCFLSQEQEHLTATKEVIFILDEALSVTSFSKSFLDFAQVSGTQEEQFRKFVLGLNFADVYQEMKQCVEEHLQSARSYSRHQVSMWMPVNTCKAFVQLAQCDLELQLLLHEQHKYYIVRLRNLTAVQSSDATEKTQMGHITLPTFSSQKKIITQSQKAVAGQCVTLKSREPDHDTEQFDHFSEIQAENVNQIDVQVSQRSQRYCYFPSGNLSSENLQPISPLRIESQNALS